MRSGWHECVDRTKSHPELAAIKPAGMKKGGVPRRIQSQMLATMRETNSSWGTPREGRTSSNFELTGDATIGGGETIV